MRLSNPHITSKRLRHHRTWRQLTLANEFSTYPPGGCQHTFATALTPIPSPALRERGELGVVSVALTAAGSPLLRSSPLPLPQRGSGRGQGGR